MRAASLDRRVRREARALVKEARDALRISKKKLKGKAGDLEVATSTMEKALASKDLRAIRHGLPTLDAIVDELLQRPKKSTMRNYVESIGGAILIALALRAFVVEAFKIPTSSMYPTLEINDHIFVNKFLYGLHIPFTDTKVFQFRAPERGEVIVFEQPCEKRDYIKRIVAVAGDTVEVRCDFLFVNGKPLDTRVVEYPRVPPIGPDSPGCRHDENSSGDWEDVECSRFEETSDTGITYNTYQPGNLDKGDTRVTKGPKGWELSLQRTATDFPGDTAPSCATPRDGRNPSGCEFGFAPRIEGGKQTCVKLRSCDDIVNPNVVSRTPCVAEDQQRGRVESFGEGVSLARGYQQVAKLPGVDGDVPNDCKMQRYYVVPEGHVFCMGDNRNNSNDSRIWGSVPLGRIKGKAMFMWFSYKSLPGGIRWDRIGNFVHR